GWVWSLKPRARGYCRCRSSLAGHGPVLNCSAWTLAIVVRIGNAQRFQNLGLQPLHDKGLRLRNVVIAQKMQETRHDQMGKMIGERLPLLGCFTLQRLAREDD